MYSRKYLGALVIAALVLLLGGCLSPGPSRPIPFQKYPVTVDYDQGIEVLARAGGYYRVYSEISSRNFPPEAGGTKDLQVTLVRLRDSAPIEKVLEAQRRNGLRPATIRELLAFANTYPDMLKSITVAGLGSSRKYSVTTYERFGMTLDMVEATVRLQQFFPSIDSDPFGLALVLIQEDMIPAFDPGAFYGCFVAEE